MGGRSFEEVKNNGCGARIQFPNNKFTGHYDIRCDNKARNAENERIYYEEDCGTYTRKFVTGENYSEKYSPVNRCKYFNHG